MVVRCEVEDQCLAVGTAVGVGISMFCHDVLMKPLGNR